jgi:hypothetical protein
MKYLEQNHRLSVTQEHLHMGSRARHMPRSYGTYTGETVSRFQGMAIVTVSALPIEPTQPDVRGCCHQVG